MNNTEVLRHVEHAFLDTTSSEIIVLFCLFILFVSLVVGLVTNSLILCCIKKQKSLQTFVNAALVNSCAVNILACAVLLPMRVIVLGLFVETSDNLNRICKSETFLRSLCEIFQLAMLVSISFERYNAVLYPFDKDSRLKRVIVTIFFSWCFAIVYAIVSATFLIDGTVYIFCYRTQTSLDDQWANYEMYVNFPFGIMCFVLVIAFYICIIRALMKQSKKMLHHAKVRNRKVHPTTESNIPTPSTVEVVMTPSPAFVHGPHKNTICDQDDQKNKLRTEVDTKRPGQNENETERNNLRPASRMGKLPKISISNNIRLDSISSNNVVGNKVEISKTLNSMNEKSSNVIHTNIGKPEKVISKNTQTAVSENAQTIVSNTKSCLKTYEVYEADGTVRVEQSNNESVAGAVCMFNPKNREHGKRKLEAKIAKNFAIGIGLFGFVWIPTPIIVMAHYHLTMLTEGQFYALTILSTFSSTVYAVNPLITIFTNRKIKTECLKIVKKLNVFGKNN